MNEHDPETPKPRLLMQTARRQFIKSSRGCDLGMTLGRTLCLAGDRDNHIPIGFQLYTVRGEFSRNAPQTLKTLGQLAYKAVEFWGYGGTPNVYQQYSSSELRKLLVENDLKCCGMHLELKTFATDNLRRTIEKNQARGK